jgi:hypothetical protein
MDKKIDGSITMTTAIGIDGAECDNQIFFNQLVKRESKEIGNG